ncbi:MAG: VOC family protein [Cyanothece sp. SIO1E1]|nr:VOC family protein [Cyanothece sp. SIO1E1]
MEKPQTTINNRQIKAGLHVKRPCLLVADLERSLKLYRDILGFTLDYMSAADPESYLYKVFQIPAQAQLTFAALNTEHEIRAIALTEVKGVPLPPLPLPHRVGIVIQVNDVSAVIAQMIKLGLTIVEPSFFTAPPNLSFTEQGFYDFDGHLIVLYETKVVVNSP